MTDENSSKSNKPTFIAYTVKNRPGDKDGIFTRIGAAFANADGKGYNVVLDCIPLDGRITLRVQTEKPQKTDAE